MWKNKEPPHSAQKVDVVAHSCSPKAQRLSQEDWCQLGIHTEHQSCPGYRVRHCMQPTPHHTKPKSKTKKRTNLENPAQYRKTKLEDYTTYFQHLIQSCHIQDNMVLLNVKIRASMEETRNYTEICIMIKKRARTHTQLLNFDKGAKSTQRGCTIFSTKETEAIEYSYVKTWNHKSNNNRQRP